MTPAGSRTCRWWASRLDGMASMAASPDGDASPASRVSAICSRAGSASAAWTAARRARPEVCSAIIDSILTELFSPGQDDGVSSAPAPLRRRLIAEFLGSAFLAALRLSPGQAGLELLENSAVTAAGLFAVILMFGPVSGGHFNPVVSFTDAAFGGLSWGDATAYLPAQVAGCTAGTVLANLMFALPAVSISAKHRASGAHFLSEVIATLGLLLVIFALARSGRARTAPAAVGAYIGAAYWFTSSTSFANPAITIGRMLSDTFAGIAPASVLPFIAAQVIGGALAVLVLRVLYPGITAAEAADVMVPDVSDEQASSPRPAGDGFRSPSGPVSGHRRPG